MNADAAVEAKKIVDLSTEASYAAIAASVNAAAGLKEEAVKILTKLLKEINTHYIDPLSIAMIYAALRDEARALEWLEKAVNDKSAGVPYISVNPMFDLLRDNPRFREIWKKAGLG
jgi:tetratricopeptide (TPR) repeat protein